MGEEAVLQGAKVGFHKVMLRKVFDLPWLGGNGMSTYLVYLGEGGTI